ncbi:uncharacterized protein LOC128725052 [Anopheles nili]|uniref:uncharacterized protein LOC128725052 n=1 Tax=Anopheles nili TaxID=185578 RepID=UPI00237C210B|nr:uncharacterized protein LOC128725052 [Anopheles nili]
MCRIVEGDILSDEREVIDSYEINVGDTETAVFNHYSSSEEDYLQANEVPSSDLIGSSTISELSRPFIDKSLTGKCSNVSSFVCTGCRRIRVCIAHINDESMLPETNCPPSTYCNTLAQDMGGACLAVPDVQFPECTRTQQVDESGFKTGKLCTGKGVFPDPQDCRKFFKCTQAGNNGRPYKCPSGYVYNSKDQSCSRSARCHTVQCRSNGRTFFQAFPQDHRFYAFCNFYRSRNQSILKNVIMYKCDEGSEFNSIANTCVFKCHREGFMAKQGDPSKYFWCRKIHGQLFGYENVCPGGPGAMFSAKLGICLPPVEIPSLKQTNNTLNSNNITTGADTPVQIPYWTQWASIPVSSLL